MYTADKAGELELWVSAVVLRSREAQNSYG